MKADDEHFTILVSTGEDGLTLAACVELPVCVSQGRTADEALANVSEAIGLALEAGDVPFREAEKSTYIHVRRASDGTMRKVTRAEWLAVTAKKGEAAK